MNSMRVKLPGWVIPMVVFTVLVVMGARAHPLWGDEAETALFARNILKYGVPRGWDGTNIMGINNAVVLNTDLINHTSPWAQYYMTAASFAVFGEQTFTARLLPVILSIASLPLLYALVLLFGLSRRTATLSVVVISLSVPYLLFSYQARYYSIVTVCALAMTYAALALWKRPVWMSVVFSIAGSLFFYGNYVAFVAFYAALFVAMIMYTRAVRPGSVYSFALWYVALGGVIAAFTAPWFLLFKPFESRGEIVMPGIIDGVRYVAVFMGIAIQPFMANNAFPIGIMAVWIGIILFMVLSGKSVMRYLFPIMLPLFFLICMAVFTVLGDVDTSFVHTRYTMLILPFLGIGVACVLDHVWRRNRYIGAIALILYIGTNIFTVSQPRFYVWEYVREMLYPYITPDSVVAAYLAANARQGDTAFVNLDRDHEPLIFHLGDRIRFVNRVSLINTRIFPKNRAVIPRYIYDFRSSPDWVILYSKRSDDKTFLTFDRRPLPPEIDLMRDYEETVFPVFFSDMSRPEMELRSFTKINPEYQDQVFVYKKRK